MKKLFFVLSLVGVFAISTVISAQNAPKTQSQKEVKSEVKSEKKAGCCDKAKAGCCDKSKAGAVKTGGCNHDKNVKCDSKKCSKACPEHAKAMEGDVSKPVTKDKTGEKK
ncbi:MAG: hypothetical protein M0R21_06235 [Lentimicrobiaceae bacterium]|nr:hypothetical protein [Lentimicrobiaceae bacterium]